MRFHSPHRPLCLVFLLLCTAACASTSPKPARITHAQDPNLPKCAGSAPVGCLTTPNCQYDESRQCQMCVCSNAWTSPQQMQAAPFGPPP